MSRMPPQAAAPPPKKQLSGPELEAAWRNKMPDGSEEDDAGGLMSADEAGYQPPDQGPFECNNCMYFVSEGQPCQKVADAVQGEGCCNEYASKGAEDQAAEHSEGAVADADTAQSASY